MDTEFINAFIQRQKNLINELQAKLLLCETNLEITQSKFVSLQEENSKLKADIEKQSKKVSKTSE